MKKKEYKKNKVWQNDSKGETIVHDNIRLKASIEKNRKNKQYRKLILSNNAFINIYSYFFFGNQILREK